MNNTIAIITIASIFTVFSCKNAEEEESTASRSEALNTDSLTVGVDHASGGFTVKISGNQSIATKKATDCPIQSNGYYTCNFGLSTGPYSIEFLEVPNYATPEPVVVKLTESGGTVNVKYKPK